MSYSLIDKIPFSPTMRGLLLLLLSPTITNSAFGLPFQPGISSAGHNVEEQDGEISALSFERASQPVITPIQVVCH
jgi:hypothetical protein